MSINGKATIMNPWFEAYIPMMIGIVANCSTLIFNAWINKWWAGGNLILVGDQVFATVQFILFGLDVWNIEIYQYDLRILRYFSFGWALTYCIFYWGTAIAAAEWLWVKDEFDETDEQAIPDFMIGVSLCYFVIQFAGSYFTNLGVVLKELTMNQFALSKDEDYQEGVVAGTGLDLDVLKWFDINEDSDWYKSKFKIWARKYL